MTNEFTQLCVWHGYTLGELTTKDFEEMMIKDFGVRTKFEIEVATNGSVERNEEGGRHDLLFYVHSEDIGKFAVSRLFAGIRWWEDVIKYNDGSYLYSAEILKKYPPTW